VAEARAFTGLSLLSLNVEKIVLCDTHHAIGEKGNQFLENGLHKGISRTLDASRGGERAG